MDPELEEKWEKQDLTIQMFKPGQFDLEDSKGLLVMDQIMPVKTLQSEEFS